MFIHKKYISKSFLHQFYLKFFLKYKSIIFLENLIKYLKTNFS